MPTTETLLSLGVCARWLVQSLKDSGYQLSAGDLFADLDTAQFAEAHCVASLDELPLLERKLKPDFAIMGSGFETHLDVAAEIASTTKLLNSPVNSVRHVRDPWTLQDFARHKSIRFPKTFRNSEQWVAGESFVRKELNRAGGAHVCRDDFSLATDNSYRQTWVPGIPMSASFLVGVDGFRVLGIFRQLLGESAFGCQLPFQFAGAIGPLQMSESVQGQIGHIGESLAHEFGLKGLFGIDFVLDSAGHAWLIEVNPRPTATMELMEHTSGGSLMGEHLRAFGLSVHRLAQTRPQLSLVAAKAILFWKQATPLVVDDALCDLLMEAWQSGEIADVPSIGTEIHLGQPIFTLFGNGESELNAEQSLRSKSGNWYRRISDATTGSK